MVGIKHQLIIVLLLWACESQKKGTTAKETAVSAAPPRDSVTYQTHWNLGDDPDDPDKSVETRFVVRVKTFRSGNLTLVLDTAPRGANPKAGRSVADSVGINGLAPKDRVTQSCKYEPAQQTPVVGVLRDSVYERWSHPQFAWLIDSASAHIRRVAADSTLCFIPGPD